MLEGEGEQHTKRSKANREGAGGNENDVFFSELT